MLCWAFKANFTNFRRRTTQVSSFHDMRVEKPANERKCVTHVYAHCVTQVCAPCREGRLLKCLNYSSGSVLIFAQTLSAMSKTAKSQWDFGELFPTERTRKVLSVTELKPPELAKLLCNGRRQFQAWLDAVIPATQS